MLHNRKNISIMSSNLFSLALISGTPPLPHTMLEDQEPSSPAHLGDYDLVGRSSASQHEMYGFDSQHRHFSSVRKCRRFLITQHNPWRGGSPGDQCEPVNFIEPKILPVCNMVLVVYSVLLPTTLQK